MLPVRIRLDGEGTSLRQHPKLPFKQNIVVMHSPGKKERIPIRRDRAAFACLIAFFQAIIPHKGNCGAQGKTEGGRLRCGQIDRHDPIRVAGKIRALIVHSCAVVFHIGGSLVEKQAPLIVFHQCVPKVQIRF